jgi:transcriptional regulator with XRE-family HTH domain
VTIPKWSGREARLLRAALRMTMDEFAAHLGVSRRTVANWEKLGERVTPLPQSQAILDTALSRTDDDTRGRFHSTATDEPDPSCQSGGKGLCASAISPESLLTCHSWTQDTTEALTEFIPAEQELTVDTALALSQEWRIVEPPQVCETRVGRRIGRRLVEVTRERTEMLRHMDDFLGGADMYDLVRRELRSTLTMMADASYSELSGRALLTAVGELCQLAGWVASDAGLHDAARRYYLGGVSAAHAGQDEPLAANLLSSLSYQVANTGDPRVAVLLATTAYQGARASATATTNALLLERVAWAYARLGDIQKTKRVLAQVDDVFATSQPADDPAFTYWLTRQEVDVMAGRCLTELHQPDTPIPLLSQAIEQSTTTPATGNWPSTCPGWRRPTSTAAMSMRLPPWPRVPSGWLPVSPAPAVPNAFNLSGAYSRPTAGTTPLTPSRTRPESSPGTGRSRSHSIDRHEGPAGALRPPRSSRGPSSAAKVSFSSCVSAPSPGRSWAASTWPRSPAARRRTTTSSPGPWQSAAWSRSSSPPGLPMG